HHFIRDCFKKKLISVDHIHTDDNVADLLTKPFDAERFQYLVTDPTGEYRFCNNESLLKDMLEFLTLELLWYALTINPTVYVSHIGQFWSTARIETTDEGTKILATVDGTPTEHHHTPSPEAQQSSPTAPSSPSLPLATTETIPTVIPTDIPTLRQYSRRARIAQSLALLTAVDEPASLLGDGSQREAFLTISGLEAEQDRENIIKTTALPHDSPPRVTSFAADKGNLEITSLKARIKLPEEKDRGGAEPSGEDATIKGRSLKTGEEAGVEKSIERSMVSVPPAAEVATVSVPTSSGLVPTPSPIFTTASVVTPYVRCKGKDKMVESDTPKKKKLQAQIDVQMAREMKEQLARED
nr:putative ribonuclease H-like domain-containing protein [Tanacetum cinerariifolium]